MTSGPSKDFDKNIIGLENHKARLIAILESPNSSPMEKEKARGLAEMYKGYRFVMAYKIPGPDDERAEGYGPNGERFF